MLNLCTQSIRGVHGQFHNAQRQYWEGKWAGRVSVIWEEVYVVDQSSLHKANKLIPQNMSCWYPHTQ